MGVQLPTDARSTSGRKSRDGVPIGNKPGSADHDGGLMSTGRDVPRIGLTPGLELPELTPDAARALLRILRKAHDLQLAGDIRAPDTRDDRGVA